jgi:hypothetical protein
LNAASVAAHAAQLWASGPSTNTFQSTVAYTWIGRDVVIRVAPDTAEAVRTEQLASQLEAVGAPVHRLAGMAPLLRDGWRATAWRLCAGKQGLHSYADGCAWATALIELHSAPVTAGRGGRGGDVSAAGPGAVIHEYVASHAPHLMALRLSHQDAHSQNVFVHDGKATLIDLDTLATAPRWWDAFELVCEDEGRVPPDVVQGAHDTLRLGVPPSDVVRAARQLRRTYAAAGR